ncbi:hypothetical protein KUCAC02_024197 [Chaenocephalus aceratus]|uniref:Uncharacterized protein n=1 Tax=Chaenocephalus aceratus TaxID=36190 RepID=A0ACB9WH45_CHAAC|nr:hypothetical protein KUCAC02_024197 [Chaenocephalus aceratus]
MLRFGENVNIVKNVLGDVFLNGTGVAPDGTFDSADGLLLVTPVSSSVTPIPPRTPCRGTGAEGERGCCCGHTEVTEEVGSSRRTVEKQTHDEEDS